MMHRTLHRSALAGAAAAVVALGAVVFYGGSAAGARVSRPPGPNCGAQIKKAPLQYWTCVFADDFNGSSLDPAKWTPIKTAQNGISSGPACYVDSPANIAVGGGSLTLTARRENAPFTCASPHGNFSTQYTSGQVATYGRFSQTYGRFAVRAKFPASTVAGLQSTLWLWPQNPTAYGAVGEVDFAEWYSLYPDRVIPYIHYGYGTATTNLLTGVNVPSNNECFVDNTADFHEYAVEWTPSTFTVSYDGRTCLVDNYQPDGVNPFRQPYFIALSQALGVGTNAFDPATTPLPATTTIDWVRAWK
jgi:beta-glucanase (GH16 family)